MVVAFLFLLIVEQVGSASAALRPPATPLVVVDPYFSVWSVTDGLADSWPAYWTGKPMAFQALVRVDGKPLRFGS